MQTLVKETVTLHKVLSRYLSAAVVEVSMRHGCLFCLSWALSPHIMYAEGLDLLTPLHCPEDLFRPAKLILAFFMWCEVMMVLMIHLHRHGIVRDDRGLCWDQSSPVGSVREA